MRKINAVSMGLLMAWSLQVLAADPYFTQLDERYVARCKWGRSIAGLAQENLLAGTSRHDFLVTVDKVEQTQRWMPRMAQAISNSVYASRSEQTASIVQEQYMNDCLQYYLAK